MRLNSAPEKDSSRNRIGSDKYLLMHKDIPVIEMTIDRDDGKAVDVGKLYVPEHLPLGMYSEKGVNAQELKDWWSGRSIPASRDKLGSFLKDAGIRNTSVLLTKSMGLSLSDHYWIKPAGSDIHWEDVNFFDNDFSEDVGDMLFGHKVNSAYPDLSSPDNTSDGWLQKRWKIIDGKRCLIKGSSDPFQQEAINEVIVAEMLRRLGIPHIDYNLKRTGDNIYCMCECFVSKNTEFVPASRVDTLLPHTDTNEFEHYVRCGELLGINDIRQQTENMICVDYLAANVDRHYNNFGIMRNPDTLEIIGVAPLFDNGSSLGYNRVANRMNSIRNIPSKPFSKTHDKQLKHVQNMSQIDLSKLDWFSIEAKKIMNEHADALGEDRIYAIARGIDARIKDLAERQQALHPKLGLPVPFVMDPKNFQDDMRLVESQFVRIASDACKNAQEKKTCREEGRASDELDL